MTMSASSICTFFVVASLLAPVPSSSQTSTDTIRVCTYNLMSFDGDDIDRVEDLRLILNEIEPHVLVVQDLGSVIGPSSGFRLFWDSVAAQLNVPLTGHADVPSVGSHKGLFFDTAQLDVIEVDGKLGSGATSLHIYAVVRVRSTLDTFAVIGGHWKAGSTSEDEDQRALDARVASFVTFILRTGRVTESVIFAGDLNVYTSEEEGYQTLVMPESDEKGKYHDPINRPGEWHDNVEFADIHTQSTRARQFGDGAHGGLDDRFDQILVTGALLDEVRPETYTTFGNDGAHFQDSINAGVNGVVSAQIAQALHDASDHLPVYVDFVFQMASGVEETVVPDELDLSIEAEGAGSEGEGRRTAGHPLPSTPESTDSPQRVASSTAAVPSVVGAEQ